MSNEQVVVGGQAIDGLRKKVTELEARNARTAAVAAEIASQREIALSTLANERVDHRVCRDALALTQEELRAANERIAALENPPGATAPGTQSEATAVPSTAGRAARRTAQQPQ